MPKIRLQHKIKTIILQNIRAILMNQNQKINKKINKRNKILFKNNNSLKIN